MDRIYVRAKNEAFDLCQAGDYYLDSGQHLYLKGHTADGNLVWTAVSKDDRNYDLIVGYIARGLDCIPPTKELVESNNTQIANDTYGGF